LSPYQYCAWNPVKNIDINGDTIRFALIADKIGKSLRYHHSSSEDFTLGDFTFKHCFDEENNLVGYIASLNNQAVYYLNVGDMGQFIDNIGTYTVGAEMFLLNGTPSPGMIQMLSGDVLGGLQNQWKEA